MTVKGLVAGHWIGVHDGDPRALALLKRHYSYRRRASGQPRGSPTFVGQGEKIVLLTQDCRALFVWRRATIESMDRQPGVCCTVFRNEGTVLSSDLIAEACELAWQRWPGERLYTYVNPTKVRSPNPGYCFKVAGWKVCGYNKTGKLLILHILPSQTDAPFQDER